MSESVINEYVHVNGVDTNSAVEGTEFDKVLAKDENWSRVTGKSRPSAEAPEEEQPESPEAPTEPAGDEGTGEGSNEPPAEAPEEEVVEQTQAGSQEPAPLPDDLDSRTVVQLKQLAEERGVDLPAKAKKPQILEAIRARASA